MRTIRVAAIFCTVLFAIGVFAAQNPASPSTPGQTAAPAQQPQATPLSQGTPSAQPGPSGSQASQGQSSIDNQVNILTEQLSLTKDQQEKVRSILVDQHEQAMTLVKDNSLSHEDKIAKIHTLREGTITKVRGTLTVEQKPKFDAMVQQQDERMRQHEQGGSSSAPGSANPPSTSPSSTPPAGTRPASNPPSGIKPPQ